MCWISLFIGQGNEWIISAQQLWSLDTKHNTNLLDVTINWAGYEWIIGTQQVLRTHSGFTGNMGLSLQVCIMVLRELGWVFLVVWH